MALPPALAQAAGEPGLQPGVFVSMDQFMNDVQARAAKGIGTSPDFQIISTGADYPIGTLLRQGTTIPIDYSACQPPGTPPAVRVPNLFPHYELSHGVAVDFALDPEAIKKLVDLGVHVNDSDTVMFSVKGAKIQALADTDVARAMAKPECRNLLKAGPAWLVRGYILGQRTFELKSVDSTKANVGLAKLFSFNVSAGPGSTTTDLTDSEETGFLQIVSALVPQPGAASVPVLVSPQQAAEVPQVVLTGASATAPPQSRPGTVEAPAAGPPGPPGRPRLSVLHDRHDRSKTAELIAWKLDSRGVLPRAVIEDVDAPQGPAAAQVRYFNAGDRVAAEFILTEVRQVDPAARLLRVRLPAPRNNFEVWLPRAGG